MKALKSPPAAILSITPSSVRRNPDCDGIHISKDFIYISPNTTQENLNASAWTQVIEGDNLVEKYKARRHGVFVTGNMGPKSSRVILLVLHS